MVKILLSPEYGAGWSTWASEKQKEIAEYKPIIDFLEAGGETKNLRPLIEKMKKDLGLDYFYPGGAEDLIVCEVDEPYMIKEYDGFESVRTAKDFWSKEVWS